MTNLFYGNDNLLFFRGKTTRNYVSGPRLVQLTIAGAWDGVHPLYPFP
jgi:hypothetical protein